MKIAVIGSGIMGQAIARSILRKKICTKEEIIFSDVAVDRLNEVRKKYGARTTTDSIVAIKGADVVILAVKPQDIIPVMEMLTDRLKSQMIISIVAGVTMNTICSKLNYKRVVRAMPNTPAQVLRGMTAWTTSESLSSKEYKMAKEILSSMGEEQYFADEKYIDMATAISGSGPAYVFLFIESFIDAGVHIGLPRNVAQKLVIETVIGSAETIRKLAKHPAELKNMVTSPGGTTAEALLQLEAGGFRSMVINAVMAAYNKAKKLGAK